MAGASFGLRPHNWLSRAIHRKIAAAHGPSRLERVKRTNGGDRKISLNVFQVLDYVSRVTYVYESIALLIFVLIFLIFVKPPAWAMRMLKSIASFLDRWV